MAVTMKLVTAIIIVSSVAPNEFGSKSIEPRLINQVNVTVTMLLKAWAIIGSHNEPLHQSR